MISNFIIGGGWFAVCFVATLFYQNCKQERQHEKEIQERQLKSEELKDSIKENDQYKELLALLKDYYK